MRRSLFRRTVSAAGRPVRQMSTEFTPKPYPPVGPYPPAVAPYTPPPPPPSRLLWFTLGWFSGGLTAGTFLLWSLTEYMKEQLEQIERLKMLTEGPNDPLEISSSDRPSVSTAGPHMQTGVQVMLVTGQALDENRPFTATFTADDGWTVEIGSETNSPMTGGGFEVVNHLGIRVASESDVDPERLEQLLDAAVLIATTRRDPKVVIRWVPERRMMTVVPTVDDPHRPPSTTDLEE